MNSYSFLLILICIVLPFIAIRNGRNIAVLICYYLSLAGHIAAVVIFSTNLFSIPGGQKDPMRFYGFAERIAESGHYRKLWLGSSLYDNLLGWFFTVTEPSVFLASMTSVLAFSLGFIVLFHIIKLLDAEKQTIPLIALTVFYALLPATLCFTAIPLREAWQILFIALSILIYLLAVKRKKYHYALGAIPFLCVLSMLHNGLYIYAILSPLLLSIAPGKKTFLLWLTIVLMVTGLYAFPKALYQINPVAFKPTPVILQIDNGSFSIANYTQRYRRSLDHGRSNYGVFLKKDSVAEFIQSGTAIVISYMFRPFPNELNAPRDIYAFAEVILRIFLITAFLWGWLFMDREKKVLTIFLGLHYTLLMLPWAAGTTTWGTALRHHTTHQFILVILGTMGAIVLYEQFKRRQQRKWLFPTHP